MPSVPTETQGEIQIDLSNRRSLPPLPVLRAFEAVGRLGGMRRAAQALGVDHAVVSRHVRTLESWTGVRLIYRTHAGGRLTAEGAGYHARIAGALAEIASATADLTRAGARTRLNIWCIPGFASQWLLSRLGEYRSGHTEYDVEIHPTDVGPDFSRHEADADLRFTPLAAGGKVPSGVMAVEIARPLVFPVASPALLRRLASITATTDLLSAPLLHEDSQDEWRAWLTANHVEPERALPGPRLWHAHLTLAAAARGEGIALANAFLVSEEVSNGRLVRLDIGQPVVLGAYALFCRKDRSEGAAMVKFRRWLTQQARQHEKRGGLAAGAGRAA